VKERARQEIGWPGTLCLSSLKDPRSPFDLGFLRDLGLSGFQGISSSPPQSIKIQYWSWRYPVFPSTFPSLPFPTSPLLRISDPSNGRGSGREKERGIPGLPDLYNLFIMNGWGVIAYGKGESK